MITVVTLHDAICSFLEKKVASRYNLKSTDSNGNDFFRNPRVIRSGWILPGSADENISIVDDYDDETTEAAVEDVFPYILPRIHKLGSVQDQRESVVTVEVYFGVYGPADFDTKGERINDGSGYRDLWNLIESTRLSFFEQHTIENRYRIHDDFFEAEMIDEQIYPYWEGYCRTKWDIAYPNPPLEEHMF